LYSSLIYYQDEEIYPVKRANPNLQKPKKPYTIDVTCKTEVKDRHWLSNLLPNVENVTLDILRTLTDYKVLEKQKKVIFELAVQFDQKQRVRYIKKAITSQLLLYQDLEYFIVISSDRTPDKLIHVTFFTILENAPILD
jgi:hypothetical protein